MRGKCWVNNHVHILKARPRYEQGFLFYSLVHKNILPFLASGTRAKLNKSEMAKIVVPVPPTAPEQRAIAEALSDVDGLLGALEALIAKKRAIKQAAMQQLLTGKTRLPGFSRELETKGLGDVAEVKSGATPSTHIAANWNGDIPWCTPTDITGTPGKYLEATERRVTREGLASCAASLLPPGALLLCSRATVGEVKIARTYVCTNQGFKSLVCKAGTFHEWLYYLLLILKPKLIERASGSTFLEIGKRDVASLLILLPCEVEQTAVAAVLSDMDAEIAALEARRDKTRGIKQGMMQQLLTGRVRLVQPEAAAA
jgi:type I restriction enzyme S subunit